MKSLSSTLLLLVSFLAVSQREISGKIQDAETGDPVEFALVYNLTQDTHTHSDIQGKFILSGVNKSDSIMVSTLGYEKQFLRAEANTDWNIFITPAPVELGQVTITPELDALNSIKAVELKLNPVNSSQEILRTVPGLFIAQHAGGGKAEQIFLRGFDIDHGTDIGITTDGMPVNMVSHAHGQGYADLHFLIPETIQSIDFGKGPYNADKGNFATAGYVGFRTIDRLKRSSVKLEAGQFNTFRGVGLIDLMPENGLTDAYLATEFLRSDGPFDSPQNFSRNNIMAKVSTQVGGGYMSISASTFQSEWLPDRYLFEPWSQVKLVVLELLMTQREEELPDKTSS